MVRSIVALVMAGSLLALPQPKVAPLDDGGSSGYNWSYDGPKFKVLKLDTLMNAMTRFRRDYQQNYCTTIRLWAHPAWNGIYATFFSQGGFFWRFFDFSTWSWVGPDTGWAPWHNAGYGGMFVNFYANNYQYYPIWTSHDYETADYHPSVWFPLNLSFNPFSWGGNYWGDTSAATGTDYIWPRVGVTGQSGYVHLIYGSVNNGFVYYSRMSNSTWDTTAWFWDGPANIVAVDAHPWDALYADPMGKTLVVTYYDGADGLIKMLVDTLEGDMFLGGTYIQKNLGTELSGYTANYFGFVGDGHPFIDRDGNIHYLYFGSNGSQVVPVEVWHFFWDLSADTTAWHMIDSYTGSVYYPVGINTLNAGRGQIGQNPDNGNLYALWEQFIQEPGRFVVSSTGDTFAPVMIKLAKSQNLGVTWDTIIVKVESDVAFGNHWIRFPVLSPTVLTQAPDTDRVIWGFYEDYDPGFAWQGQGVDSTVTMWVGIEDIKIGVEESISLPSDREISFNHYPNPANGMVRFNYQLPARTKVSLKVYNPAGQLVRTLVNATQSSGAYMVNWDLRNEKGAKVSSGTYFYTLQTDRGTFTKKLVVAH